MSHLESSRRFPNSRTSLLKYARIEFVRIQILRRSLVKHLSVETVLRGDSPPGDSTAHSAMRRGKDWPQMYLASSDWWSITELFVGRRLCNYEVSRCSDGHQLQAGRITAAPAGLASPSWLSISAYEERSDESHNFRVPVPLAWQTAKMTRDVTSSMSSCLVSRLPQTSR